MKIMRVVRVGAVVGIVLLLTALPAFAATDVIATKGDEFNAAATDTYIAWTVWNGKTYIVYAKPFGGSRFRINPTGTNGWVGSIDGTTLVYQQFNFKTGRSDIFSFDLVSKNRTKIGKPVSTDRWEYEGSRSGDWVVYARYYSRTADRKIFLYNVTTQELRKVAATSGRRWALTPDQINGNYVVWEKTRFHKHHLAGCDVFLYDITAGTASKLANANDRCQYAASVNPSGTVYFARSGLSCGKNVVIRTLPLGGSASTLVNFADGRDLFTTYAVDNGDTTTDVYFDRYRCGHAADILKITDP